MKTVKLKITATARIKQFIWKLKFKLSDNLKRIVDVIASLFALILLSPLLLMTCLLIKLDSKGSILFKQKRVGLHGKSFWIWKFRSMIADAEELQTKLESNNEMSNGVIFKMKKDPRITRVGALLRKTSIDELPQLYNVLKGEMSLVGPRPSLPQEVNKYQRSDYRRLEAVPGITCEWQVNGRSQIPFEQQVELDIHYIRNKSLWFDLILLLKTIPAVLSARGAY